MFKSMVQKIFGHANASKNKEVKKIILKEFFNSKHQKNAVIQAAKESAEDQKRLIKKYHQVVQE